MFDHAFHRRIFSQGRLPDAALRLSGVMDMRRQFDSLPRGGRLPSGCTVAPGTLGSVPGEWIRITGQSSHRLILYFHGGGYIAGTPELYRGLIGRLAKLSDTHAFAPAYRLAPEYPFPAAVRDGLDAYRHFLSQGGRPGALVLAGDGAGGGLALAVLLAIRNAGLPMPAALVAMSPWADLSLSGWSMLKNRAEDRRLCWSDLFICARQYLGTASPGDVYASPLYATFRDFPPLMIHAGSAEVLSDDAARIGEQARRAGIDHHIELYEGQGHVFQAGAYNKTGRASLQRLAHFIRAQLALDGGSAARVTQPDHIAAQ